MKTYKELSQYVTFEERFEYLKLHGDVGIDTFGPDRWINQNFYRSREWKTIRNEIIIRDNGCDLAVPEYVIGDKIYIHHINPISVDDFTNNPNKLLNPDNLICVSFETHQAIHYGSIDYLKISGLSERKPNDTKVW
jgi:hypothetical protein